MSQTFQQYPWLARQIIVKICGNVELQKLCKLINYVGWSSILFLTLQIVVMANDHCQLMCQVILCKINENKE